jgi:hypothetical protein
MEDINFTNKAMGPDALERIGIVLASQFLSRWKTSGLTIPILPSGEPALQVELEADLGDGVIYGGKLDALGVDAEGDLGVVDFKTAAATAVEGFDTLAPQLTDYQILCEANAPLLGIQPGDIQWGRFIELLKKSKPAIDFRPPGRRRTDEEVAERLADIRAVARDIRAQHFPRRAGMAFNSPCRMCEFKSNCLDQTRMDGITVDRSVRQLPTLADLPTFEYFDLEEVA